MVSFVAKTLNLKDYKPVEGKTLLNMAYGEAKKENGFESVPLVEEFVIETLKSIDTKGYTDCQGAIVAR